MDLERIKQQFRIRSGRSKRIKKVGAAEPVAKPEPQSEQLPNGHYNSDQSHSQAEQEIDQAKAQVDSGGGLPNEQGDSERQQSNRSNTITEEGGESTKPLINGNIEDKEKREATAPEREQTATLYQPSAAMSDDQDETATVSSDASDFDLKPPDPKPKAPSIEKLCESLWSEGHLHYILHDPRHLAKFAAFLSKYQPNDLHMLQQYIETQKAIKAVEYANAIASGFRSRAGSAVDSSDLVSKQAASLDPAFEQVRDSAFKFLINAALPMYVTANLVNVVSECLVHEITGRSTPAMRNLIGGLSEVFCLTDPNQEDNPIIYASEEFYRYTGYGQDDVIGHNCRFLQGRGTNPESPKRLKEAINDGKELCETLLNYRRDGRPFVNMLMIAPLYDNRGKVKYHIGAQVDVSGVLEQGKAVDSFPRYLQKRKQDERRRRAERAQQNLDDDAARKKRALSRLRDLSEMFDLEESAVVQASSRSNSQTRDGDDLASNASTERPRAVRRRRWLDESDGSDDDNKKQQEPKEDHDWKLGDQSGDGQLSGTLPGIYETFMLVRPAPSLRIVFVSPKLKKIGNVVQSPFMSHVAGPAATLDGLMESFKVGVPVSARVHFMPERGPRRDGTKLKPGTKHEDGKHGHAVWISCTPLLGADDRIGVWMVIFVRKSKADRLGGREVAARTTSYPQTFEENNPSPKSERHSGRPTKIEIPKYRPSNDMPIKPVRIDSQTVLTGKIEHSPQAPQQDVREADDEADRGRTQTRPSERRPSPQDANGHADQVLQQGSDTPHEVGEIFPNDSISEPDEYENLGGSDGSYHLDIDGEAEGFVTTRSPIQTDGERDRVVIVESESDDIEEGTPRTSSPRIPPAKEDFHGDHDQHGGEEEEPNTPTEHRQTSNTTSGPHRTHVAYNEHDGDKSPESIPVHSDDDKDNQADDEDEGDEMLDNENVHGTGNRGQSGLGLDYLRHPGTQRFRSQGIDEFSDFGCAGSPYSVD